MSEIKLTLSNTDPPTSNPAQSQGPPGNKVAPPGSSTGPPTLTLTPDGTAPSAIATGGPITSTDNHSVPAAIFAEVIQDFQQSDAFTTSDRQQMAQITTQIDLGSNQAIIRYGANLQRKVAQLTKSDLILAQHDLSIVGTLFQEMRTAIAEFDRASTERGLSGLFRKSRQPAVLQNCFVDTSAKLQRIQKELDGQSLTLSVAIRHLKRTIYPQLAQQHKQLNLYIHAGRNYLDTHAPPTPTPKSIPYCFSPGQLPQLSDMTSREQHHRILQNHQTGHHLFEKRLDDLELTKTICFQSALQALLLIYTYQQLTLQIQSHITNSIAIWQQSVATAFTVKNYQTVLQSSNAQLVATIDSCLDLQKIGSDSQSIAATYQQTS